MSSGAERDRIDAARRAFHAQWLARMTGRLSTAFSPTHADNDGATALMRIGTDSDGDLYVDAELRLSYLRRAPYDLDVLCRAGMGKLLRNYDPRAGQGMCPPATVTAVIPRPVTWLCRTGPGAPSRLRGMEMFVDAVNEGDARFIAQQAWAKMYARCARWMITAAPHAAPAPVMFWQWLCTTRTGSAEVTRKRVVVAPTSGTARTEFMRWLALNGVTEAGPITVEDLALRAWHPGLGPRYAELLRRYEDGQPNLTGDEQSELGVLVRIYPGGPGNARGWRAETEAIAGCRRLMTDGPCQVCPSIEGCLKAGGCRNDTHALTEERLDTGP